MSLNPKCTLAFIQWKNQIRICTFTCQYAFLNAMMKLSNSMNAFIIVVIGSQRCLLFELLTLQRPCFVSWGIELWVVDFLWNEILLRGLAIANYYMHVVWWVLKLQHWKYQDTKLWRNKFWLAVHFTQVDWTTSWWSWRHVYQNLKERWLIFL